MPFGSKRADLLERSLQGHRSPDQELRDLVATVGRIPPLTSAASTPRPEFVSSLRDRLRAEALTLPAREPNLSRSTTGARRSAARPKVFLLGRRLPRVLAGVTASALLVGAVVAGASRSALPGGLLYPVRQLLDTAAVQLSSPDDRGTTLLSQADEHIGDAVALVDLVDRDGPQAQPASVNQALLDAYDAFSVGHLALLGEFDRTGNPQTLIAIQDFAARALPQLDALRPMAPAASRRNVDSLISLVQQGRASLAPRVARCGLPCGSLGTVPTSVPTVASTGSGGLVAPVPPVLGVPTVGQPLPTAGGRIGVTVPAVPVVPAPVGTSTTSRPGLPTNDTSGAPRPTATLPPITISPPPIVIPPIPLPTLP